MKIYPTTKRFFDILLASLLLLFSFPFLVLIGMCVRIYDGGPAIFKQKRIGRNGHEFLLYKFRSMSTSSHNVESRHSDHLQITSIGKIIRVTNMDELPQFYNVLKGDMSFIGPRPSLPSQNELVELRRKNGALAISPGMTGWAQVNAYDGMSTTQKAIYDGEYASRMSFKLDFLILLKTIVYFTKKPPIY